MFPLTSGTRTFPQSKRIFQVYSASPAAEREQANYRGGKCAGCHGQVKKLPPAHPDTNVMNLHSCKRCHTKENRDITGKLAR
jgi:hypothetical protein